MQQRPFGSLGAVGALTLGGGGLGQVWGHTTREECVATVREAVTAGITLLDLAPGYGNGEAETVVGEAFGGILPPGVRVTTKCRLGSPPPDEVYGRLSVSLDESLAHLRLSRVDLFFLHNMIVPEAPAGATTRTDARLFREAVVPAFERLVAEGRIGAWGITGIGEPDAVIAVLESPGPRPVAVQCIANLLDSPGGIKRFEGPARPRDIIAAAGRNGVAVMGIRAVQAGALTSALDRELPEDHPEMVDFRRAAPFRAIAAELRVTPAFLAHQYALSMEGVATVVLGVKNREELRECLAAEAAGPLAPGVTARIDAAVGR
jgi:aryl-alcohol dehydrogenase-like predicted oxidoreductase